MKTKVFCPSLLVPIPNAAPKVSFLPTFIMYAHIYLFFYFITKLTFWFTCCDFIEEIS